MSFAADQIVARDGSLVQTYKDSVTLRHIQGVLLYGPNGSVAVYDTSNNALRTVQVNQQEVLSHALWWESTRAGNPITCISTGLNALAGGGGVLETSTISNDTERDMHADFELVIPTLAAAPANGDTLADVYFIRQIDGTNFETASSTVIPAAPDMEFKARGTATAQRLIVPYVQLPARSFRLLLINRDATAYTASGNTLKMYAYSQQEFNAAS